MTEAIFQPAFFSGEISPTLYSRVDLPAFKTGARKLDNYFVDYRGGFSNRPGSKYVLTAKDSTHDVILVPFQYSNVQTYVLEFGHQYMRVIMNGAYVLETSKNLISISNANPGLFTVSAPHGFGPGDWVFVAGAGGMTQVNGRFYIISTVGASDFRLTDLFGNPIDTTAFGVYTGGGTVSRVFTLSTPYVGTDLARLNFSQNQDTMTLTHTSYEERSLTRTGNASWTLTVISFGTIGGVPGAPTASTSVAGTTGYSYLVTAVYGGVETIGGSRLAISNGPDMNTTAANIRLSWNPTAGADHYNIYKAGPVRNTVVANGNVPAEGELHGFIGTTEGTVFADKNITQDFSKSPPIRVNPFAPRSILDATVLTPGTGYGVTGTAINVTDSTGTGAVLRPVVDPSTGAIMSVVVIDGGRDYSSPTVTVVGAGSGAVLGVTSSPASGIFPGVSAFFQQRQVFAATVNSPQGFWMTKTGTYANLDVSNPLRDDDAISGTIASQQVNDIRHMISMPGGLLILTGFGAWSISANGSIGGAVTPFNIAATPQAYTGASYVHPLLIGVDVIYVQEKGSTVRSISYNFYYNAYSTVDIGVKSNHLLFGRTIVSWAYAEEPFRVIWAIRDDGTMLSITYIKDQEIIGWAQHHTVGSYRWAASISEGAEHAVYFVVDRVVQGQTFKYIERMASRNFNANVNTAWFLDSALQYVGAPATNVINLDHLEGRVVGVLADGVFYERTVVGRTLSVPLPIAASTILVGFEYQCDYTSLSLELNPTIQGKRIKVSALTARVTQTRELRAGTTLATLTPSKFSTTPVASSPQGTWANGLFDGDDRIMIDSNWQVYGTVYIRQTKPYPVTITGLLFDVEIGDR